MKTAVPPLLFGVLFFTEFMQYKCYKLHLFCRLLPNLLFFYILLLLNNIKSLKSYGSYSVEKQ